MRFGKFLEISSEGIKYGKKRQTEMSWKGVFEFVMVVLAYSVGSVSVLHLMWYCG